MIRREYNEQNKVIRESYEDHTGAPMTNNEGYVAVERTYDSDGTMQTEKYILPENTDRISDENAEN